jgi:hypothetical protein
LGAENQSATHLTNVKVSLRHDHIPEDGIEFKSAPIRITPIIGTPRSSNFPQI